MNPDNDSTPVDRAAIRLAIVDDDAFVRNQLSMILGAAGFNVVGTARDGDQVLDLVRTVHPDVILMDVRMDRVSGIEATLILRRAGFSTKVIALTSFDTESAILDATKAGVNGFLGKTAGPQEFFTAIEHVAQGHGALSPFATKVVLDAQRRNIPAGQDPAANANFASLTPKELEAVALLVNTGGQNSEIARHMHVSETSVKSYLGSATSKVGAANRTQLALWAQKAGVHEGSITL